MMNQRIEATLHCMYMYGFLLRIVQNRLVPCLRETADKRRGLRKNVAKSRTTNINLRVIVRICKLSRSCRSIGELHGAALWVCIIDDMG
jgi:hypothetical protein